MPWVLAAVVFTSVFFYHHNFFYGRGGYFSDAGIYAYVFHRNGVLPRWPPTYDTAGYSDLVYAYHLGPDMTLFSLASYLVPVGALDWFSLCQGLFYAMIAWAMGTLAVRFTGEKKGAPWTAAALALGIVYTLNGFVISCLGYPHLEIAVVAFGLCFLAALLRGKRAAAVVFFALACGVREDGGFHLAAILFALWASSFAEKHLEPLRKRFLIYACAGVAAGAALLAVQRFFVPHLPSGLFPVQYTFFGNQETPTLSWPIMAGRIAALPKTALSLLVAAGAGVVCAAATRRYSLAICWAVYIPWFALNLIAAGPRHGLGVYHVFPFIFAVAMPLMALPPLAEGMSRGGLAKTLAVMFLLGISSTAGQWIAMPGMCKALMADLVNFHFAKAGPLNALADSLQHEPQLYGRLGLDDCAACICLDFVQRGNLAGKGAQEYDTLVFFKGTMFTPKMLKLALGDRLDRCLEVAGTNALVVSNREIPALTSGGKPLLKPTSLWLSMALFKPQDALRLPDGTIVQREKKMRILVYGPYVSLPAGKYRVKFQIDGASIPDRQSAAANSSGEPVARIAVTSGGGAKTAATAEVNGASLPASEALTFEVRPDQQAEVFEFCVTALGRGRLAVKAISLEQVD